MTVFSKDHRLWLFGCGNMVGAMLERWLAIGLDATAITVIDPHKDQVPRGIRLVAHPPNDEKSPRAVVLGVEPQVFRAAVPNLSGKISAHSAIISVMAGIRCRSLSKEFPNASEVVRTMPNLPVALGKGVTIAFSESEGARDECAVTEILGPLGALLWVEREELVDVGTAVSGSGTAFVYRFIDAIAVAAERLGFTAKDAQQLALCTVTGSAELATLSGESLSLLVDRVASRGGTTRAGLNVLDGPSGMYDSFSTHYRQHGLAPLNWPS